MDSRDPMTLLSIAQEGARLAEKATPGPWNVKPLAGKDGKPYATPYQAWVFVEPALLGSWANEGKNTHDAELAAHAGTHYAVLCRAVIDANTRIESAILAERERCAKVLESMPCPPEIHRHDWDAYFIDPAARAIRSKS